MGHDQSHSCHSEDARYRWFQTKCLANKAVLVVLPSLLQWGQPAVNMSLHVGDTPYGVDNLMGLDIQDKLQAVIDRPARTGNLGV